MLVGRAVQGAIKSGARFSKEGLGLLAGNGLLGKKACAVQKRGKKRNPHGFQKYILLLVPLSLLCINYAHGSVSHNFAPQSLHHAGRP
jgi:hypothetical protein